MNKVYVSHIPDDAPFVEQLTADLALKGHDVWVDLEDIGAGSGWRTAITKAIRSCRAFLLVLSNRSVSSSHIVKELSIADSHNRLIIPVLVNEVEIPHDMEYQLADLQLIDFSHIKYEDGLKRILAALDSVEAYITPFDPPSRTPGGYTDYSVDKERDQNPVQEILVEAERPKKWTSRASVKETNRLAIVSLISSLLGLSLLPGIASSVALVAGYKARKNILISEVAEKGLGIARAGILLGWIGVIVGVLVVIYFISEMGF
jgi:hypothetical protein